MIQKSKQLTGEPKREVDLCKVPKWTRDRNALQKIPRWGENQKRKATHGMR